ncbi:hypothetical protein TVAG_163390 [Trichomonas vaginalis G3]|uniref:Uncharacterized protein n=1 Tax=Trichomonas vaginalis (strain ATCC PRA-98 / G3) TaxID=412133 RepID=A2DG16_TRIV3|nr:surfeit locus protein 5 subunit 22 of Mediator complex family [Trichomonas vaginalis G3]EAY20643.1 hypothetical protein TVAG_163390 [Trichomonas vaginalis G3]KAI5487364.1 surfeit locus protein 5 subunit 22 of Mediator complex family [Trichomonas vaginalis G3]|eukprot:XP_001581629.1 hypothetical protein [Trichomonas vaginalis G3]
MEKQINDLRMLSVNAIANLVNTYSELIKDSIVRHDDVLDSSRQKLKIEVHTMEIDQNARELLTCIRRIKELKVTDDEYQSERASFEQDCIESSNQINDQVKKCYKQLTDLSTEGFEVLQAASKLLR